MRILVAAAIIALLFESVGSAQSLADRARSERARRENPSDESATYTTEQIQGQYAPVLELGPPVDPELLGALEDLRDRLLQFGVDMAAPIARILDDAAGGSNPAVETLEAFEAGVVDVIGRLATGIADPSVTVPQRGQLEILMLSAQGVGSQVRSELAAARRQSGPPRTGEPGSELNPAEIEATGGLPAGAEAAEQAGVEGEGDDPAAALAQQQALVQRLADSEVRQSLEIGRLRGFVTAVTGTQAVRNTAQTALGAAEQQLTDTQAELEAARAELERLQAEMQEQAQP